MADAKIDLYKLHKDEYAASGKPRIVETKPAQYLTVDGKGEPGGEVFTAKLAALYGVAYTIKMGKSFAGPDYTVCKLEGFWWGNRGKKDFAGDPPDTWHWKLAIRTPDYIGRQDLKRACDTLIAKGKGADVGTVVLETIDEGPCVQMLHVGPYNEECVTITAMLQFAKENRLSCRGRHHEIYLSDPRRVSPEKLRTILRMPVA